MVDDLIGLGIYTLQEAALYSGLTPNKLSRWVFGIEQSEPVIDSQLSDERLISFRDLVQAMAINRAREEDVPLQKIREATNISFYGMRGTYSLIFQTNKLFKLLVGIMVKQQCRLQNHL